MMVLVGSRALAAHCVDTGRPIMDIDVVGSYDSIVEFGKSQGKIKAMYPTDGGDKLVIKTNETIIEGEIVWDDSSAEDLITTVEDDPQSFMKDGFIIPSFNMLYTLKMSHRYKKNSPHFLKTMRDIQLMRKQGATIPVHLQGFYERRMKATYTYNHPKLNQSKKDFFSDDGIKYVYDHDDIHEAVKHLNKPAYQYFKPVDSPVLCDKNLFFAADEKVRLYAVLEESYVLALERSQIPCPGVLTPKQSFDIALMKVCTSITSGWFREFSYENYDRVQSMYSGSYVDIFWDAEACGMVKPHNKGVTKISVGVDPREPIKVSRIGELRSKLKSS